MLDPAGPPIQIEYTDVGPMIDGIPQVVPEDGWYWLQVGLGPRHQWYICYIQGMWVKTMVEVWHWSKVEFHERHLVGPKLEPPGLCAAPYVGQERR